MLFYSNEYVDTRTIQDQMRYTATLRRYHFKVAFRISNEQSQSRVIPVERFCASLRQTDKLNEHMSARKAGSRIHERQKCFCSENSMYIKAYANFLPCLCSFLSDYF